MMRLDNGSREMGVFEMVRAGPPGVRVVSSMA